MIKIYLPNLNSKFFNNIRLIDSEKIKVFSGGSSNIYRTHANVLASAYIFDSSQINSEIIQFAIEHTDLGFKIFIYHSRNKLNKDCLRYLKQVNHIVEDEIADNLKYKNIIHVPKFIINNAIFYNTKKNKIDRKIYFLDDDILVPDCLQKRLYPNTNDRILMFNNSNLRHNQNLGFLSEPDKAKLLNNSKYFICNDQLSYAAEAYVCGCDILDCDKLENHKIITELQQSTIVSYKNFIEKIIL
jgi:hypothetical protein